MWHGPFKYIYYCKKKRKLWKHTYLNGARVKLDHILVNKKWRNSAIDCQAYNTIHPIQSDHWPCTAKIRLSLRANKTSKPKKIHYDWSALSTDDKVRSHTIEVKNRSL